MNILFSIVIPTYNRPDQLSGCLDVISKQNFPSRKFEVIVVDDGSRCKVSVKQIIESFTDRIDLLLLRQENQGPATARNTGAKKARGEYIVFTDDDCHPTSEWLKKIKDRIETSPDCMIGGKTINALTDNPYSEASQVLVSYLYDYYNTSGEKEGAPFFTSNNITIPLKLFHEINGFDQGYPLAAAEDRDFCERWLSSGYRMEYDPDIVILHRHDLNFKKFWKQHFNYGHGSAKFHGMRFDRSGKELKFKPLSFYTNLVFSPFTKTSRHPFLISSLLLVSQLANALGFLCGKYH